MNNLKLLAIPTILIFVILIIFLNLISDGDDNRKFPDISSKLFNTPTYLKNTQIADTLNQESYIINFFASWCGPCLLEHPALMALKKNGIIIVGINFRDNEEALNEWLTLNGNPFEYIIRDDGDIAFEMGLIGVPETFFIEKNVIIKKIQGPLFGKDIEKFL